MHYQQLSVFQKFETQVRIDQALWSGDLSERRRQLAILFRYAKNAIRELLAQKLVDTS
jgi:hypothetical protein